MIAGAGGSEAECEEIALVESEIMTLKIGERAHEKAGTNHEHHRRSDLRDDERFAEAMLVAWIRNGGRVVLHGGQEVGFRCAQGRGEAKQNSDEHRDQKREEKNT